MKWIRREEWRDAFADFFDHHLANACTGAGVEIEDLSSLIGEQEFSMLFGSAFEDFLSSDLDDGRNIVDDYLKRRGWKESVSDRAYMAALRSSVMSLYEVSEIVPGESFLVRDLVRGGDAVCVSERSATKSLRQWDRIAARVLDVRGKTVISGAVLSFNHDVSEDILASLHRAGQRARKETAKLAKSLGRNVDEDIPTAMLNEDAVLGASAFMFSNIWLSEYLSRALDQALPQMSNTDGEALEFQSVHYPLLSGTTLQAVRAALASIPEMDKANNHFWNWVEARAKRRKPTAKSPRGPTSITTMGDGGIVLGNIELKKRMLTLSVNSRARGERGRALLDLALTGLVREPLVETQTMEQMMASRGEAQPRSSSGLSPEDERAIVHKSLDDHYGRLLDEPIPALGNLTPVKAVKTAKGRSKVIAWLKGLENHSSQMPKGDPMASYDFVWLWEKLGLADQRR
jgi:hypothetical protein